MAIEQLGLFGGLPEPSRRFVRTTFAYPVTFAIGPGNLPVRIPIVIT